MQMHKSLRPGEHNFGSKYHIGRLKPSSQYQMIGSAGNKLGPEKMEGRRNRL